jgi:hypothetical protein
MKIKALKELYSSIANMKVDEEKELELDEPTFKYWTDCGLIEVVPETIETAPTLDLTKDTSDTVAATSDPAATTTTDAAPAPAPDVTSNETK